MLQSIQYSTNNCLIPDPPKQIEKPKTKANDNDSSAQCSVEFVCSFANIYESRDYWRIIQILLWIFNGLHLCGQKQKANIQTIEILSIQLNAAIGPIHFTFQIAHAAYKSIFMFQRQIDRKPQHQQNKLNGTQKKFFFFFLIIIDILYRKRQNNIRERTLLWFQFLVTMNAKSINHFLLFISISFFNFVCSFVSKIGSIRFFWVNSVGWRRSRSKNLASLIDSFNKCL